MLSVEGFEVGEEVALDDLGEVVEVVVFLCVSRSLYQLCATNREEGVGRRSRKGWKEDGPRGPAASVQSRLASLP